MKIVSIELIDKGEERTLLSIEADDISIRQDDNIVLISRDQWQVISQHIDALFDEWADND